MRTILILATVLVSTLTSVAQTQPPEGSRIISKGKSDSYYLTGIEAYTRKDYVSALKYLFAYKLINIESFTAHAEDEKFKKVLDAITTCETELRLLSSTTKATPGGGGSALRARATKRKE